MDDPRARREDLAWIFEQARPRLRGVAYRLLGSAEEAEDAVQETWVRLDRAGGQGIDEPVAWLTTVVSRVSLNLLRARRARREDTFDGVHIPDPVLAAPATDGPEHEALAADAVGLALLVVLDTLEPAERLAFVLHDVFAVPFADIAELLERSPDAARQLASRARRRVRSAAPEPDAGLPAQREVVDAFFAAGRAGDFTRLVELLHPDVVLRADTGPGAPFPGRADGADAVARRARMFADPARDVRAATVNGAAGAVVLAGGQPVAVMAFTVVGGRIAAIDALVDPTRLRAVDLTPLGLAA